MDLTARSCHRFHYIYYKRCNDYGKEDIAADLLKRLLKTLTPEDGKGEAKTPMAPVGEA